MSNADNLRRVAKQIEKDDPEAAKALRSVADIAIG